MADNKETLIIKKITYDADCAHKGAWKIAFADLMTAVMAFFLLLWVLNSTNDEEKKEIAQYFRDPTVFDGSKEQIKPEKNLGITNSVIDEGGRQDVPKSREGEEGIDKEKSDIEIDKLFDSMSRQFENNNAVTLKKEDGAIVFQINDEVGKALFDLGSDELKPSARVELIKLGKTINHKTVDVVITGYTDALPFKGRDDYDNYDLSTDRAKSARRAMIEGGMDANSFSAITGKAATDLIVEKGVTPYSPKQRRIVVEIKPASIINHLTKMSPAP